MKLQDKKALREKSVADLTKEVDALRKELTVTMMQFRVGKLAKVSLLRVLRQKIAIIQTLIGEKNTANI